MSEIIETPLRGKISVRAHHLGFGVVELDEPQGELKYAIINDKTKGRIALMNLTKDGGLPIGQKVVIKKAEKGVDAFIVLDIVAAAMSHFEQFSKEINDITRLHPTSRLIRLACRIEYWRRRYWTNEVFHFKWVGDEGVPVGKPIEIVHMTLHDMMEHQAQGVLTGKVLLEGLRANAIQRLKFEPLDKWNAKTTIQPRWV